MSIEVEVTNISYDCFLNGINMSATVLPTLPKSKVVEVEVVHPDEITRVVEEDWLVTGYDYRVHGGDWVRYDEDMSWLWPVRFAISSALSRSSLPLNDHN